MIRHLHVFKLILGIFRNNNFSEKNVVNLRNFSSKKVLSIGKNNI